MDPNNNQAPQGGGSPAPHWQQGDGGQPVPPAPSAPSAASQQPNLPAADSGTPTTGSMGSMPPRKKLPPLVFVALAVVVVILAAAVYFVFFRGSSANNAAKKSSSSAVAKATDLATMQHATLNVPATIAGYKARETGSATIKDFLADDGNCEFVVGIVPAQQLPGADLNAIVAPQIAQLKNVGASVSGPNAGTPLILKDAVGSKKYSMPTITFGFSQDKKHAVVHYSAAILQSTDRAIVNRTCVNKDGTVDASRLRQLDNLAQEVTVTIPQS